MPKITAKQAQEKQAANLKASTRLIEEQVKKVTVAPGELAAKKADKMLTNLRASVESGEWAAAVASVPVQDWQRAMIEKGIPRIGQGIDAAAPKVLAFYEDFFPYLEGVQKEVAAMPDLTLDQNIARAVHAIRRQSEYKRKR